MDPEGNSLWDEVRPDLTPLIDGVFLLLIFFMVTMVFARPVRLRVELAEARNPAAVQGEHRVQLVVDREGAVELEGESLAASDLEEALSRHLAVDPAATLTILVDRRTPHTHTLQAMEAAQRAGLNRVFLATRARASGGSE